MNPYFTGFMLGLAYAAPIGAQNLYVINNASRNTISRAYFTALCVAFQDIALAAACFWGMGLIIDQHPAVKIGLLAFGTCFLLKIGVSSMRNLGKPIEASGSSRSTTSVFAIVSSAVVLTWCNPQAILDGSLLLGSFRASLPTSSHLPFFCGVAAASASWFFVLTTCMAIAKRVTRPVLPYIGFACGAVMVILALKMGHSATSLILEQSKTLLTAR